jgi:phage-related protein (TIGR01555 family)
VTLTQFLRGIFSGREQQQVQARQLTDAFGRPLRKVDGNEIRGDAWVNGMTGLGTSADKSQAAHFAPVRRLTDAECTNMMNGSALAAKIVEKRPKEMYRRGYQLQCAKPKGDKKVKANVEQSEADELHEHANERFKVDEEFPKAQIYANLYGGGVLLMGADDGGMQDEPLEEDKIRAFRYVNFVDRRFVYVQAYYNEPLAPNYGRPSHYLLSNGVSGGGFKELSSRNKNKTTRANKVIGHLTGEGYGTTVVHESRLIRFEGVGADQITMQSLAGWTWSVLQRVYDDMKKYESSFDAVRYLMQDASQAVFMLEGLIAQISAGQSNNIRRRIQVLEETRSVMHGIVLDAKTEKFERSPTTFGGLGELLDKMMLTLSAAVDIPVTELFGRAPGGLNSTTGGDAEQTKWYDSIASLQKIEQAPRLKRFYRLLSLSQDCPIGRKDVKWEIKFHPLREPTDDEMAKRDLTLAQKDQIYISEGVVSPEEVALERQDQYASMDVEAREEAAKKALSFDPHENDPDDIPDPGEIPSPAVPLPVAADPRNPKPEAPLGQTAAPAGGNTGKKPGGGGGGGSTDGRDREEGCRRSRGRRCRGGDRRRARSAGPRAHRLAPGAWP